MATHIVKSLARISTQNCRFTGFHLNSFRLHSVNSAAEPEVHRAAHTSEVEHHAKLASEWWDRSGPLKGLHSMNAIRVPFIRDGLIARNYVKYDLINTPRVLEGLHILEVGCGGGILTEQLARIRANVTAIDLGDDLIATAKHHLQTESPDLVNRITYKVEPIEVHAKDNQEKYDAVVISEVLEHITDKAAFLTSCLDTLKPGGSVFITTLNKTIPLWIGGIFFAENVFKIVPKGTHHWDKLISPLEVQRILDTLGCTTVVVNGCFYEFWRDSWKWVPTTDFCYAVQAIKH